MKYIAKMMLAALASVALAVPAYAWDFSASGSASTSFNITSTVASTGAHAVPSGGVMLVVALPAESFRLISILTRSIL